MLRRFILPTSVVATTIVATYFASTEFQDKRSSTDGKKKSVQEEFPLTNKEISTYERLTLNDVYNRYRIKTLDRKHKENVLGEGSYAHVIGCTEVTTGKSVALKVVKKAFTKAPDFEREVSSLMAARFHPNIVQLLDVIDVPDADSWLLVTELLEGGELFDRILQNGAFSEPAAAALIRKVASALQCLHKLGWAHNDVKPENLVYCNKSKDSDIKLVDFGMARRHPGATDATEIATRVVTRDLGTTAYWPPEVLNKRTRFQSDPRAIDSWTLGVLTYILIFGCHPFDRTGDASEDVMVSRIGQGTKPSSTYIDYDCFGPDHVLTPQAKSFIQGLLEEDPSKRLSIDEVLKHPWIVASSSSDIASPETISQDAASSPVPRKLRGERHAQTVLAFLLKLATDSSASRDAMHELGAKTHSQTLARATIYDFDVPQPIQVELDQRHLRRYEGIVYDVGDHPSGIYVLVKGMAQLEYPSTDHGGHVVVQNLFPGDLFGETAILEGRSVRNARIKTLGGPVEAYFFSREDVVAVLSGSSELKEKLDDLSARRYRLRAANALVSRLESNPDLAKLLTFKRGESIFTKGELAKHIYLVRSGVVKSIVSENTKKPPMSVEQPAAVETESKSDLGRALGSATTKTLPNLVVGEWGPGDLFGISALYGSPRFATAVAQTPVQVFEVKREDLERVLEHEPMLRENLAQQFRTFKERSSSIARKYTKRKSELKRKRLSWVDEEDDDLVSIKKGDVLFKQGDSSSSGVFFVQEGEIHLVDDQGKVRYVNKEGMTFGTESFVKKVPRKFTAVAGKDTKLVCAKVRRLDDDDEPTKPSTSVDIAPEAQK